MNLVLGTLLQGGKYRIESFIGSGGFGCTYQAIHVMLNTRVAVKEFFSATSVTAMMQRALYPSVRNQRWSL